MPNPKEEKVNENGRDSEVRTKAGQAGQKYAHVRYAVVRSLGARGALQYAVTYSIRPRTSRPRYMAHWQISPRRQGTFAAPTVRNVNPAYGMPPSPTSSRVSSLLPFDSC